MRSGIRLLWLAVLLSLSAPCFSESVSQAEIATALEQILAELETASTEQAQISTDLDETRMRQESISTTLETLQDERLPDISRQLTSLETYFDDYVMREERRTTLLIGATAAAIVLSVIGLIF